MNLRQRVDTLRQDSRLSLRLMRRSPIFFGAAILTLALGIGANGAVFSILQSVLLQPMPYDDASRVVVLSHMNGGARPTSLPFEFNGPFAASVREAADKQLGEVAAGEFMRNGGQLDQHQGDHLSSAFDVSIGDRTVRLSGAAVTPNFFRVLGVRAALGRVFTDRDGDATETPIILSDATWRREFGADPNILGRAITVNYETPRIAKTFTVAGVLPRGVHFSYPVEVEAWIVMPWTAIAGSDPHAVGLFTMVSRIRPGLSMEQARKIFASVSRDPVVTSANPQTAGPDRLSLTPMREWIVGDTRPSLYLLGGVAALLLLVTCVTVANGLLTRIAERQQELAVRSALGAERSRVVQQLLIEGMFLAVAGTIVGTLLAILIQPILRALLPGSLPQIGELGINGGIIAFAAIMAALTTIFSALAPALGGTRENGAAALTRSATGATAGRSTVRWRHGLIGAQAALTTMLLIFSTLLLTSLWRLGHVPLGFDSSNVVAIDVQLLNTKYRAPGAMTTFQDELLRGVRAVPGVTTAGVTSAIPFRGLDAPAGVRLPWIEGEFRARMRYVDSAYFATLRVPILRGRLINSNDRTGSASVAVISESFARRVFGADDPIGRVLPLPDPTEIVGVVGDLRYNGLEKDAAPAFYVPASQYSRPLLSLVVRINPAMGRAAVIDGIRHVMHSLDPGMSALNVATLDAVVDATIAGRRFYSVASGAFAILALTLTTIGLVLVVARAVAERRRELAIRSALGATLIRLARAAVGDAMVAIAGGVVAGLFLAAAGSVLLAQFLFQITARSPNAYAGAAFVVIGVATVAAWLPMRRFARLPLAELLRQD